MTTPSPAELADLAVALAEGAAEFVRVHRGDAYNVSSKSSTTDLVTDLDRRTEQWLLEQIQARRPDDAVLGEEGAGHKGSSGVRWVLDPIDGTVNFVLGLPHYAVSVAAEVDGVAVAGAVCNPVLRETFHAHRGGGAFLGERPLPGSRDVSLDRSVIGTGFNYDRATRTRQAAVVSALLPLVGDIRRFGAASLDLCAVAAGRLDGYFEVGLQRWDHAAGVLIAGEAGCRTSGLRGRAPSRTMTAVAAPGIAAELFALLERLGADEVSS